MRRKLSGKLTKENLSEIRYECDIAQKHLRRACLAFSNCHNVTELPQIDTINIQPCIFYANALIDLVQIARAHEHGSDDAFDEKLQSLLCNYNSAMKTEHISDMPGAIFREDLKTLKEI